MGSFPFFEIFAVLFMTMGPIKPLITFAEKTVGLERAVRRRIAIRAVGIATVVGLIFIFFGILLMDVFKFSSTSMSLAGGLILLIYAINSILKEPKSGERKGYATDREAEQMAVYPLAMPLMASPMGLVALTVISASDQVTATDLGILALILLLVMAINLVALLTVNRIAQYLNVDTLDVANRILGLLLAALAVETLINGGFEVLKEAVQRL